MRFGTKALVVASAALLLVGVGTSAHAVEMKANETESGGGEHANQISTLVAEVAANQGRIVSGNEFSLDPSAPIPVHGPGSLLKVSLPQGLTVNRGMVASDSTVVFPEQDGVAATVQSLDSGAVRIQTVINSPSSAHEFVYSVGDRYQVAKDAAGQFWAVGFDEAGSFTSFSIAPAWARDANGNDVPTHYEARGNTLIQVVEPTDTTSYPIVADPTWQWYNTAYGAGFSKTETKNLAAAAGAGALCGKIPSGALQTFCIVASADWGIQAGLAANEDQCVFIAAVPAPIAMRWLSPECN